MPGLGLIVTAGCDERIRGSLVQPDVRLLLSLPPGLSQPEIHLLAPVGLQPGFFLPRRGSERLCVPSISQSPAPGGRPGQALSSSPARTWPPAPRPPSPVRSLRAGPRPGSCCGPGCSIPPPWGCGRGSCRSLLGRWKRVVRLGLNPCAPSWDKTRIPNHKALGLRPWVRLPCSRPPTSVGPKRRHLAFQLRARRNFNDLEVGLWIKFHPRLTEFCFV